MSEILTRMPTAKNGTLVPKPAKTFSRARGIQSAAARILLYGEGGIGKSETVSQLPGVVFADLERGTSKLDVERVEGIESWQDLRGWLQHGDFEGVKAIAIDTGTAAEEMCIKHVLDNVPTSKGKRVSSIKDYGWNDGYTYVYEEWRRLLGDFDRHYREGRSVVLICHARTGKVPNPTGEDYIRFEPRLLQNNQVSVMAATVEWSDHTLFLGYDINVGDNGVAVGGTTRTLYTTATATHIAKNRGLGIDSLPLGKNDPTIWNLINQTKPAASSAPGDLD